METTPQSTPQSNPFAAMHKQRLYSLVIAAVALITMLFAWYSVSVLFYSVSVNGFHSWGWLSFFGIAAVAIAVFMGNKEQPFDSMFKNIATAGFGAIALGAILFFVRLGSFSSGYGGGGAGIGLWACLIVGLAGLAFLLGFIKVPQNK